MPSLTSSCADAAQELVREWNPRIEAAVARRIRCHADREDAAQRARLALINAAAAYDASCGKPFENYAATCIANAVRDFAREGRRRNARFRTDLELPDTESRDVPPIDRIMVMEFVSRLPDQSRRVYEAIYEMGYTHSEAAKMLGVSRPRVSDVHRRLLNQATAAMAQ